MWRNLKKYLQERGVSVSGYLKTSPVEIASAVERMVLAVDVNFEKDQINYAENLIIHDMLIPDPFLSAICICKLQTMQGCSNFDHYFM